MRNLIKRVIGMGCLVAFTNGYAEANHTDYAIFHSIFTRWTEAFNRKDLAESCQLFSKKVVADYQGLPKKNYADICGGFKKIFSVANERYQYRFKLRDIYHAGNLAVVRITWYLQAYRDEKLIYTTQDEGIDIFRRELSGRWKIVNYLGYEAISNRSREI